MEVDGDVSLSQRMTLPNPPAGVYTPYLGAPLPSLDSPANVADFMPAALLAASRGRNCA